MPTITDNQLENIPEELRAPPLWLAYYLKPDPKRPDKKPTKHPCVKYSTPEYRKANLRPLDHLLQRPKRPEAGGFQRYVDKAEGFIFIDLDHVRNAETGELEPAAERMVDTFDTYCEISASGKGLHLVCRGILPEDFHIDPHQVEIYSGNIPNKLIAMTGDVYELHHNIRDCQEQASELLARVKAETLITPAEPAAPALIVPKPIYTLASYPLWAWEKTPYHDFAIACRKNNNIPYRFFVEALKTTVGAICGHRLRIPNSSLQARFYTVLLSDIGGVGKSTAIDACERLFRGTGLLTLRKTEEPTNIGCFRGTFGSGVGLRNKFMQTPRILSTYDELSSLVEKLGIKGSGQDFLGVLNTLYESNIFPPNITKDTDLETDAPADIFNSILGLSIQAKWEEMFAATSADNSGFFMRLNIVYGADIKKVPFIEEPDLTEIRERLLAQILPLERAELVLAIAPPARKIYDDWYYKFEEETKELPGEVTGRTNTLVLRNAMQIAWLNGLAEIDDLTMIGAVALGEYAWRTRLLCRIAPGKNDLALLLGKIKKELKQESPWKRNKLYGKVHAERVGLDIFNRALNEAESEGWIQVERKEIPKSGKRGARKEDVIHWLGD